MSGSVDHRYVGMPWLTEHHPVDAKPTQVARGQMPGTRVRFAMSRNLSDQQFGTVYQRDPERKTIALGHFTGGAIYHHDSPHAGREQ